jgi:hypothetical protein
LLPVRALALPAGLDRTIRKALIATTGSWSAVSTAALPPWSELSRTMKERDDPDLRRVDVVDEPVGVYKDLSNRGIIDLGHNSAAIGKSLE